MKNNKGITLVSLIGYIVISLMVISILIIVTSNFKKNFGELNVQTVHDVEFDKINLQISKEIREGNRINREKTTESKLTFKDNKTYSFVLEDKAVYLNDNIKIAEYIDNCKFEIIGDSTLKLIAEIEGKTRTLEYTIGLYVDRSYIQIGDYVSYTPTVTNHYQRLGISTDENANPSGTTENSQTGIAQDTTLNWRVMNIGDDGSVELVADRPIQSEISLKGALGFNNGVFLLNDLCNQQYSNRDLGCLARSIDLLDIEANMNSTGLDRKKAYVNSANIQYGTEKIYENNSQIPEIYKKVAQTTMGESLDYYKEPTTLKTRQESNIAVKNSYYDLTVERSYYNDMNFYDMIFATEKNYWVASRYTYCQENDMCFGLRCIISDSINGANLFVSTDASESYRASIRPVVHLGADIKISQNGGTLESPRTLSK